ncbi:hypothetical protein QF031_002611 [Pseudarthrobacter defluvii]|uniref:hypothetical protein n=1 Tax=Pseudarthrobacter defluvii TaxID=410837 RepID=UPI00277D5649|nr:hypothetical protein [Pseudarthrobacter defluvii]MDQ0769862.1 hypothetical protein [Pseudarthrobacter defluvii]
MKTSALGTFGACALLAVTASACGGAPAPQAAVSTPAAPAATASPANTPSPSATPTPTAKAYTSDGLAAIVAQVRDAADRRLSVLPGGDIKTTLEQTKAMIASIDVKPAECKELAAASTVPSVDGATMAMGMSTDAGTGAVTALSVVAGLDQGFLAKVKDQPAQLQKCSSMTMTASGMEVAVTVTLVEGAGSLPGTVAYRTDSALPDGQKQSTVTAQAVKQGVVLTAVASGGESEADAVRRAGALLDSAAAQVK